MDDSDDVGWRETMSEVACVLCVENWKLQLNDLLIFTAYESLVDNLWPF
jgi:hypothetical protein